MKRPFLPAAVFMLLAIAPMVLMRRAVSEGTFQVEGFKSPILQAEFFETSAEVAAFYGPAEAWPGNIGAMRTAHAYDNIFLVLYGLFLAAFAFLAFGLTRERRFMGLILLAVLASLADFFENESIMRIARALGSGERDFAEGIARLRFFTWLKWLALALYFVVAARFFWKSARFGALPDWFGKLFALVCAAVCGVSLAAYWLRSPQWENWMASGISLLFLGLFVFCLLFQKFPKNIKPV